MTLFVIDSLSLYGSGKVNIDDYITKIRKYENLLKRVAEYETQEQSDLIR